MEYVAGSKENGLASKKDKKLFFLSNRLQEKEYSKHFILGEGGMK